MDPERGLTVIFQDGGHDNSSKTGNPSGCTVSPVPTGSDKQSGAAGHIHRRDETELPSDGGNFNGGQGGITVVDAGSSESQWCSTTSGSTQYDN